MRDLYLLLATANPSMSPSPSPSLRPGVKAENVTPGVEGFVATALVVAAAIILMIFMVRKIRAVRYREQVREEFEGVNALDTQTERTQDSSADRPSKATNKPWRHERLDPPKE